MDRLIKRPLRLSYIRTTCLSRSWKPLIHSLKVRRNTPHKE
jgi:hypothetical protein